MRIEVLLKRAVWASLLLPAFAAAEEGFIVPGVDFSRLAVSPGAWCRYMVVDRALGIEDSTEVYIAIPSRQSYAGGEAFWVEIVSKPVGATSAEREAFKLLISEGITQAAPKDSLVEYVLEFYIQKGHDPIRSEDPARLSDFPVGFPTADSSWNLTRGVNLTTSIGDFSCEKKERSLVYEKEVPAGRIKLLEKRDNRWSVWFSEDVPIFHLVRCFIERSKDTETIPAMPGIPAAGRRESQTAAELIGYGFDAKPTIIINP